MKLYHKLSYEEKFKRTIYVGMPLLIVVSIIVFYLASTTLEKVLVPLFLFLVWIVQMLYTYKKIPEK